LRAANLRIDTEQDRGRLNANGFRFAVVASRWNDSLVSRLLDGALEALKESDAADDAIEIFRVPGLNTANDRNPCNPASLRTTRAPLQLNP